VLLADESAEQSIDLPQNNISTQTAENEDTNDEAMHHALEAETAEAAGQ
jgi:hypothetical protein